MLFQREQKHFFKIFFNLLNWLCCLLKIPASVCCTSDTQPNILMPAVNFVNVLEEAWNMFNSISTDMTLGVKYRHLVKYKEDFRNKKLQC